VQAEAVRWIETPDAATQSDAMAKLQELAWEAVPFAPTGLFQLRTALRADLSGVLQGPNPSLWKLRLG
jgi:peptide/nickel transport system substrate-binding protein